VDVDVESFKKIREMRVTIAKNATKRCR